MNMEIKKKGQKKKEQHPIKSVEEENRMTQTYISACPM